MAEATASTANWTEIEVVPHERNVPREQTVRSLPIGGNAEVDIGEGEKQRLSVSRMLAVLAGVGILGAAGLVSRGGLYDTGSDFAYWLGIVGGIMMLLQYIYSIRKHFEWARHLGKMRLWLMMHVICGIGGPLLILFHSTFEVKSLNGRIALYTMLIVTISGLVGRYVYVRVHQGLTGRRNDLREMQARLEIEEQHVRPLQALVPRVVERLHEFHVYCFAPASPIGSAIRFATLGFRAASVRRECRRILEPELRAIGRTQKWRYEQLNKHWKLSCREIARYTVAVQEAAQFSAWERIFRLWHLAHIPLLFLLFLSSVAHIVAVHMY